MFIMYHATDEWLAIEDCKGTWCSFINKVEPNLENDEVEWHNGNMLMKNASQESVDMTK